MNILPRLNLKQKLFTLLLSLITITSLGILGTFFFFSGQGEKEIGAEIVQRMEDLKQDHLNGLNELRLAADQGLEKASGYEDFAKMVEIIDHRHSEFNQSIGAQVGAVGKQAEKAVIERNREIESGFDRLLGGSTDAISQLMQADSDSIKVLANVASFNVQSLNTSIIDGLRRINLLVREIEERLYKYESHYHDELDKLLIKWINSTDAGQDPVTFLIDNFDQIKAVSALYRKQTYQELALEFYAEQEIIREELTIVNQDMAHSIGQELGFSQTLQGEHMERLIIELLESQGRIKEEIEKQNELLLANIQTLQTDLPMKLKQLGAALIDDVNRQGNMAQESVKKSKDEVMKKVDIITESVSDKGQVGIVAVEGATRDKLSRSLNQTMIYSLIITGLALLIAFILGLVLLQTITKPIRRIVTGLKHSADYIMDASEQLSSSSFELAQGASRQAASVEETSAALEQITARGKESSALTRSTEALMTENIQKSGQSLKSMVEMMVNIARIEAQSDQMKQVINMINGFAFQTNLLALNASVEAARAGEAGAGFAVVAGEVRSLALKAAQSAEQIQQLLGDTVAGVQQCSASIKTINHDFEGIIESATVVGERAHSVTLAISDQTKGLEQISLAGREIDEVVQQFATGAEEFSSASVHLSSVAKGMNHFVSELMFMISGHNTHRTLTLASPALSPPQKSSQPAMGIINQSELASGR